MKIVQTTKEPFSICKANQWTGFYMITASVMKGLSDFDYILHKFQVPQRWKNQSYGINLKVMKRHSAFAFSKEQNSNLLF